MSAEAFMQANPFPPNGEQLNQQYYKIYQETDDEKLKTKIYQKVVNLNARLIGTLRHRNGYFWMDENELMSLYGEGVKNSLRAFDLGYINHKNAVGNHIILHTRSLIGKYVHQDANLIKIPTNIKKGDIHQGVDTNFRHIDVDEFSDILGFDDDVNIEKKDFETLYSKFKETQLSKRECDGIRVLEASFVHQTRKDIAEAVGLSYEMVRVHLHRTVKNFKTFTLNYLKGEKL